MYATALSTDNIYTLKVVVNGKNHITSGSRSVLEQFIDKELSAQQPTVVNPSAKKIEVYKQGQEYRAKIISFTDHHSFVLSDQRTDEHNPGEATCSRKMIGLDVPTGLQDGIQCCVFLYRS